MIDIMLWVLFAMLVIAVVTFLMVMAAYPQIKDQDPFCEYNEIKEEDKK